MVHYIFDNSISGLRSLSSIIGCLEIFRFETDLFQHTSDVTGSVRMVLSLLQIFLPSERDVDYAGRINKV
jgi:hypothetical protein